MIDLNTATVEQLDKLPGVGPAKAQWFIEYRSKTPFTSVENLREFLPEGHYRRIIDENLAYVAGEETEARIAQAEAPQAYDRSVWIAGAAAGFLVLIILLRAPLTAGIDALGSRVRILPRLAVISLATSALAGLTILFLADRLFLRDIDLRFEARRKEAVAAHRSAWDDFFRSQNNKESVAYKFMKDFLYGAPSATGDPGDSEDVEEERGDLTPKNRLLSFAFTDRALSNDGIEMVYLDRRSDPPRWLFSPGIPEAHRSLIRERISYEVKQPDEKYASQIRLKQGSSYFIAGETDPEGGARLYFVTRSYFIPEWGEMALINPADSDRLDEIRVRSGGHPVVYQRGGRLIASSVPIGRPVADLPGISLWEARYLMRRVVQAGEEDLVLSSSGMLTASRPAGATTAFPSVRRDFLALRGTATRIYGKNPDRIASVIGYTRIHLAIPRDPSKIPADGSDYNGISRLFYGAVRSETSHTERCARRARLAAALLAVFPPENGGSPELLEEAIQDWAPELTQLVRERLDWRPRVPFSPLNLRSAGEADIARLLKELAIPEPDRILTALGRYLGPPGETFASSDLPKIEGLAEADAEILAGVLYQRDTSDWDEARALLTAPLRPDQVIHLGGREYVATLAYDYESQGGSKTFLLVDRTAFLDEIRAIRQASGGAVAMTSLLTFLALLAAGGSIVRPTRRLLETMRLVREGSLDTSHPVVGRDEFAEIASGFNAMLEGIRQKVRLESSFRRYVPDAVVRDAARADSIATLGGEIRTCSILFADIRGFTQVSQTLSPADVVTLINKYFAIAVEEIQGSGGTVDKFIGDAILAVWGAPDRVEDCADRAVRSAVRIQERILEMNREREAAGDLLLYLGIGISTGEVLAGHVGTERRADWTVIGSEVNLAQRISSVAWPYRVLVSENTVGALRDQTGLAFRQADALQLKGFEHPVRLQTVLWYDGHSGPLLEEDRAGEWFVWDGETSRGPFTLTELVRLPGFSAQIFVSRAGADWIPWFQAARDLRVWSIRTPDGPRGLFTLAEVAKFPGNTSETMVRLYGDPGWRTLGEVTRNLGDV